MLTNANCVNIIELPEENKGSSGMESKIPKSLTNQLKVNVKSMLEQVMRNNVTYAKIKPNWVPRSVKKHCISALTIKSGKGA